MAEEPDQQLRHVIFGRQGTGLNERRDTDYKGIEPWPTDKAAKAEIAKDIVALANWEGGWLVWGVTDALDAVGVTRETADTFDSTQINQFVNKYVEPPITTTVFRPTFDGVHFVVVHVPVFPQVPHLFVKSYPGVWNQADLVVRSASNSSQRIQSVEDFRRLLDRAVRLRADWLLSQFRGLLTTPHQAPVDTNPWFQSRLEEMEQQTDRVMEEYSRKGIGDASQPRWVLTSFVAELGPALDHEALKDACGEAAINHDGSPFFFPDRGSEHRSWGLFGRLERNYSANPPWPTVEVWQLDGRGLFQHAQICGSAALPRMLLSKQLLRMVTLSVETAALLFSKLFDPSKPMTIRLELRNAENLFLTTADLPFTGGPTSHEASCWRSIWMAANGLNRVAS